MTWVALADLLIEAWSTPGRHYHGIDHLLALLDGFAALCDEGCWSRPEEVWLALAFHDAVYVPGAQDNEAQSAALAQQVIPRLFPNADVARVCHLIQLTAVHGTLRPDDVDPEAALFLDLDMSVLGAAPEIYARYAEGVAAEYSFLDPALYAAGRGAFLTKLLQQERIFLSARFHARLDAPARQNLAAEQRRWSAFLA